MKPQRLFNGDKVAIVSLSGGALGENFAKHELELGLKRLTELGLKPVIMPNSTKGIKYLSAHPEARAQDLVSAFEDKTIKAIICAIGGDDTYKVVGELLKTKKFANIVKENPKIFMGFSDSTIDHLMLNSLGLNTFYGPAFLTDFAELADSMLSYTQYFVLNMFLNNSVTNIESSAVWYKERTDFSPSALHTNRDMQLEENGYICLCGGGKHRGALYGGCLDSIYTILCPENPEQKKIFDKHKIFNVPDGAMLFLETSDNKPTPEKFRQMLQALKSAGAFEKVSGVLFGKPQDEEYFEEYKKIISEELKDKNVLYNLNFGHAYPRAIIPYNIMCEVDFTKKTVKTTEKWFNDKIL